jgi:predicted nucleotide-binding protein (sugar kinase/HSP70/actin superfamily)
MLITNFGCGPDSFIIKYLEELFRDRSFLVLEVDEHASDVGARTRIEAFLNNLREGRRSDFAKSSARFRPFIPSPDLKAFDGTVYLSRATPIFRAIGAAFSSVGIRTRFLPPHDDETRRLGLQHVTGRECLPYIMYAGDLVRMTREDGFDPERSAFCIPGSNLSCRVSAYSTGLNLLLDRLGCPRARVLAPRSSMDKDELTESFGMKFAMNTFRGILALDLLEKMRTETRPYELSPGDTDVAYAAAVDGVTRALGEGGDFHAALREGLADLGRVPKDAAISRPVVGLVGDEYTRGNPYVNKDFIKGLEALGAEVWVAPVISNYIEFQRVMKPRTMWWKRRYAACLLDAIKLVFQKRERDGIVNVFRGHLRYHPDPDYGLMIEYARNHLDDRLEPLILVGLAQAIHLIKHRCDGLAALGAFQCMIDSVISATLRKLRREHGNLPMLNLTFDLQKRVHQRNRIEAFMHQVRRRHDTGDGR